MKKTLYGFLFFSCLLFCGGFWAIREISGVLAASASIKNESGEKGPYKDYSIIIGVDENLGAYETLHYEFNN